MPKTASYFSIFFTRRSLTSIYLPYSHSLNSDLANLTWKDFNQKHTETSSSHVANLIQNTFEKNENLLKNKPVISLSAGIDSTLILTLLRKNYPDLPLESISISFPNSVDESEKAQKIAEKLNVNHNIIHVENFFEHLPEEISTIIDKIMDNSIFQLFP